MGRFEEHLRRAAGSGPVRFDSTDVGRRVRRRRIGRRAAGAAAAVLLVVGSGALVVANRDDGVPVASDGHDFCALLDTDWATSAWPADVDAIAYLDPTIGDGELAALVDLIDGLDGVESTTYLDQAAVYEQLVREFRDRDVPEMIEAVRPEILSPSVRVVMDPGTTWDRRWIEDHPGVYRVVSRTEHSDGPTVLDAVVRPFASDWPRGEGGGMLGMMVLRYDFEPLIAAAPDELRADVETLAAAVSHEGGGSIETTPETEAAAQRILDHHVAVCGGSPGSATSGDTATDSPTTTASPVTSTTTTPADPDWVVGAQPLPLRPDGFGEVLPTPDVLVERSLPTPDVLPPPPTDAYQATISRIDDAVAARMGSTWSPDCPVGLDDLHHVTLSFWGFDGGHHTGELIVHRDVAEDIVEVFGRLHEARFPLEEVRIVTDADLDAAPTGDGNATSAFVCRPVRSGTMPSAHASGLAIDINPFNNPYVQGDVVVPELASAYLDRSWVRPGMIVEGDVVTSAFADIGWTWAGTWDSPDLMHFTATGR